MRLERSAVVRKDILEIIDGIGEEVSALEGKTILIPGGAGFLGRYFVLTLKKLNEDVFKIPCKIVVMDNFISSLENPFEEDDNIELITQDISKPFDYSGAVDYILHAASIASPVFYNKFRMETIDVGFLGTKNLLELARRKNTKSFLFFSSSEIYGNPDPKFIPTPEDYLGNVSCVGPRACYDEPKRIGETLCVNYGEIHNVPVKIVRPFNVFGPGMRFDDGRVVPNFVISALEGKKLPVYRGGSNTRTFCYITDAMIAFFKVLLSDHNLEVFNVGSDEQEIQIRHLADLIHGLVENEDSSVHSVEGLNDMYKDADPNRRCPDLGKIRSTLGYLPKVSLINGLKRFISWAKEVTADKDSSEIVADLDSVSHTFIKNCRSCDYDGLLKVLSLGETPLANNLISSENLSEKDEMFPLEILYCPNCCLCQLSCVVSPKKLFSHYLYVTSTTDTFKKHFMNFAEEVSEDLDLSSRDLVVDIGSNDGLLLKNFSKFGIRTMGVESARNISELARKDGVDTINDFFNEKVVEDVLRIKGNAKVITANNVFAHIHDIKDVCKNVKNLLSEDGVFIIEVQYLADTLQKMTFDNVYHEHLSYFSVISLKKFFESQGMELFKIKRVDTHGGSIRVFVKKKSASYPIDFSIQSFLQREKEFGLDSIVTYKHFADKVYELKSSVKKFLENAKSEGKKVIGYGAPAKATTLLNFYGVNHEHIDFVIDDNPLKHNMIIPGVRIPIKSKDALNPAETDYLVILAWNFADEIMRKNENLLSHNVRFVLPTPELKVVESELITQKSI